MQNVNNFSAGKIALASPDRISLWSRGEVSVASGGVNSRMPGLVEGSGRHRRIALHTSWQGGDQPRNV